MIDSKQFLLFSLKSELIEAVFDLQLSYVSPKLCTYSEIQFVYPNPKGSKLIFFTPFRAGVNEENRFADYYKR
jgi:hypothetical protein